MLAWAGVTLAAQGGGATPSAQRGAAPPPAQGGAAPPPVETVRSIAPAADPMPAEDASRSLKRVSFIVYGDTRGGASDGVSVHPIHDALMDRMLAVVRARANTDRAIRFVLQTGDAVLRGGDARMWNVSYVPVIERLTRDGGVPYFLALGNHDVLVGRNGGPNGRDVSLRAMEKLYPPVGSPRRYGSAGAFAFGIGPVFVVVIDSNAAADPGQVAWLSLQLDGLDRKRYKSVMAVLHHAPYTSGPHGQVIEPETLAVRSQVMPLLRKHHVRFLFAGHEHFFEQWVERYRDGSRRHRLDIVVTGGGGAPTYSYRGEPDLAGYLASGVDQQLEIEHLVRPGPTNDANPNHFLIIDVDGDRYFEEVVTLGERPFAPFGGESRIKLD